MIKATSIQGPPVYRGHCWLPITHCSDNNVPLYKGHLSTEATVVWHLFTMTTCLIVCSCQVFWPLEWSLQTGSHIILPPTHVVSRIVCGCLIIFLIVILYWLRPVLFLACFVWTSVRFMHWFVVTVCTPRGGVFALPSVWSMGPQTGPVQCYSQHTHSWKLSGIL